MEENKKDIKEDIKIANEDHVKIYDKEIYISQEKLRTIILIIAVFLIGFVAGYFSRNVIKPENAENANVPAHTSQVQEK